MIGAYYLAGSWLLETRSIEVAESERRLQLAVHRPYRWQAHRHSRIA
jgi:hypothetical protein